MKKVKQAKKGSDGHVAIIGTFVIVLIVLGVIITPGLLTSTYENEAAIFDQENINNLEEETLRQAQGKEKKVARHVPLPDAVKTIYMTSCVVGTPSFRDDLVKLVDETEINSIIIDIKDFSGSISFPTKNDKWKYAWEAATCGTKDMGDFIETLHEKGVYVIGRVTVFQDPLYTKMHPELAVKRESDGGVWKDHKGLSFIEVGAKEYWQHVVELAEESYELGFDEINFDYIRFPSDGNMNDIYYPFSQSIINANGKYGKQIALEEFFKYLDEKLRAGKNIDERPMISADLFGMTATNKDDLNIGQVLERALPYFDFIAPMVYPSHYPTGFNGYGNPNHYPYEIVNYSMSVAAERVDELLSSTTTPASIKEKVHKQQLRPWLQDFDYGGDYGPKEVRTQIQATYDAGLTSWMLWAPSNRYTRGALLDN